MAKAKLRSYREVLTGQEQIAKDGKIMRLSRIRMTLPLLSYLSVVKTMYASKSSKIADRMSFQRVMLVWRGIAWCQDSNLKPSLI